MINITLLVFFRLKHSNTAKKYAQSENSDKLNAHAERNAIKKFNSICSKKKNIKRTQVNLLVVRFSKSGEVGESRPCLHCLQGLLNSKIKIKWIYYSNAKGAIVREKLITMLMSDKTYISSGNCYKKWRDSF